MKQDHYDLPKPRALFVHAMGDRSGQDAWPAQQVRWDRPTEFLTRRGWGPGAEPLSSYTFLGESEWLGALIETPIHLVAASWSGVLALELALLRPEMVASLVLCEPAVLSLAVDTAVVMDHIEKMQPAYKSGIALDEFGRKFSGAWGNEENPEEWTKGRRRTMARMQRHQPPWEANIDHARLRELKVPTLVVSSGLLEPFETIAERMADAGTEWRVLGGPPHRPQDGDVFNSELAKWWDSHDLKRHESA